jgi:hypothetical protein
VPVGLMSDRTISRLKDTPVPKQTPVGEIGSSHLVRLTVVVTEVRDPVTPAKFKKVDLHLDSLESAWLIVELTLHLVSKG